MRGGKRRGKRERNLWGTRISEGRKRKGEVAKIWERKEEKKRVIIKK